jgi:hypothetical protein
MGPAFPPPNGTATSTLTGAANPGLSGGTTVNYTAINPNTTWSKVYWGISTAALPGAGLDNTLHTLSFVSFSGQVATWQGTTSWTNPDTGTTHTGVPVRMVITVTGLGASPWVTPSTLASLDPGPGTGMGAAVNDTPRTNFQANVQFLADIPTDGAGNFIPINNVRQGTGGTTRSSVTLAFYTAQ